MAAGLTICSKQLLTSIVIAGLGLEVTLGSAWKNLNESTVSIFMESAERRLKLAQRLSGKHS